MKIDKIGMIGTGALGSSLGRFLSEKGYAVKFGSREPDKDRALFADLGPKASVDSVEQTAQFGDAVFLAVPWTALSDVMGRIRPVHDKIVVDCTNPLTKDLELALGFTTSGAEELAKLDPTARVVKAFNTVFANIYKSGDLEIGGQKITMPLCSDNEEARLAVAKVIQDLGMSPLDAGPLRNARCIEPQMNLLIRLGIKSGLGTLIAWKLLQR